MITAPKMKGVTLYDNENGFFIPNDRKKFGVGENAGFKFGEDGGIRFVIAAEQPKSVPEEQLAAHQSRRLRHRCHHATLCA
jgi:hypothetical protein